MDLPIQFNMILLLYILKRIFNKVDILNILNVVTTLARVQV